MNLSLSRGPSCRRVLVIAWPGPGHTSPLLAVADRVHALGHAVEWLSVTSADSAHEAANDLGSRLYPLHVLLGHPPSDRRPNPDDLDAYVDWSKEVHFGRLERRVARTREMIRRIKPDVIAVSGLVYDGVIAAQLEGIPYVCLSHELTLLMPPGLDHTERRVAERLADARTEAFARFGFVPEFRCNEALSPYRNLVFTTETFIGSPRNAPARTTLVGPAVPFSSPFDTTPFPWERLAQEKPIVYAALGSQLSLTRDEVRVMARATQDVGAQLVVATGVRSGFFERDPRGDVIVVPAAPQAALLECVSAFVTHGGANSVMEAMLHGVPLLVQPVRYDQPLNAHFVVQAGVGMNVPPAYAREWGYAPFLTALLQRSTFRDRAQEVKASYRAHDGAGKAAEILLALAAGPVATPTTDETEVVSVAG